MKPRNTNLDVLRAIAVFLVLGRHFECFPIWTQIGWAGVDLFFVLSGFLISGLLFTEWKKSGALNISRFYARRGLKIYPAFYVLAAVSFAIVPTTVTKTRALADLFFVQNYIDGIPLLRHTWSLGVEEHFYIALPLILWLMTRCRPDSKNPFRLMPAVFLVVALGALTIRIATTWRDEPLFLTQTHVRFDALLFGVLLGYYRQFEPARFRRLAASRAALVAGIVAIASLILLPLETLFMHTIGLTVVFLGFGLLLARAIDLQFNSFVTRLLRPLAVLGSYSYSIYLWHFIVALAVPRGGILLFLSYVAGSIVIGIAMAKIVEYPVLRLRDRWFPTSSPQNESLYPPGPIRAHELVA